MTHHGARLMSDIQSPNYVYTYIWILSISEEIFMGKDLCQQYAQHKLFTGRKNDLCLCTYSLIPSPKIYRMSIMNNMESLLFGVHSQIKKTDMKLMNNHTIW